MIRFMKRSRSCLNCSNDFRERVLELGQASAIFRRGAEVYSVNWACMRALNDKWRSLITSSAAARRPLLVTHMSDGWGINMREQVIAKLSSENIRRETSFRAELLLERQILETLSEDGSVQAAMKVSPPMLMKLGKACWHLFAAATDSLEDIRTSAPRSITMLLCLQDGLHAEGFGKKNDCSQWSRI